MWPLHCTVMLLDVTVNTDNLMSEEDKAESVIKGECD